MLPAIRVDKLSKYYRLSEKEKRGGRTISETLMSMVGAPFQKVGQWLSPDPAHYGPTGRNKDVHWALKSLSFQVQPGEVIAVIGPNGAGKSTLFKILSRVTKPSSGFAEIRGRLGSLLEVGTGFHTELTGRENVFLNGAFLGMSRREIARKFDEIVAFAEIDQFIDMPVKRYSSGMHVRLAFAVAAHLEPDVLLLDEILAVGDAEFQKKSRKRIDFLTKQGITTLIISHSIEDLKVVARRGLYIRGGSLLFDGDVDEAEKLYASHTRQELEGTLPPVIQGRIAPAPHSAAPAVSPALVLSALAAAQTTATTPAPNPSTSPIVDVVAANAMGDPTLREGDDLHVTVRYRSMPNVRNIDFQIAIWTRQEQMLACADTRFGNPPEYPGAADGKAVCIFPGIPLQPGRFFVRVALIDPANPNVRRATFGWPEDQRVCSFVVESGNGAARDAKPLASNENGLLRLPVEWCAADGTIGHKLVASDRAALGGHDPLGVHLQQSFRGTPLVLSVKANERTSFHFTYPDDPEKPVNILINTQKAPESAPLASNGQAAAPRPETTDSSLVPAGFRREMAVKEPNSIVGFLEYGIRITTGMEFYSQFMDVFSRRLYQFDSKKPDPVIIDAGSRFGVSVLYFKHAHRRARVLAFEPSPELFRLLQENVKRNRLNDVTLINAGLGGQSETASFSIDPITGSRWPDAKGPFVVQMRALSEFIREPVDFLKLDLDGQEWAVIDELNRAGKLTHVKELAIVCHTEPNRPQRLGGILEILSRNHYRYLIHEFDSESNPTSKPPFRIHPESRWSCLIYARLADAEAPAGATGRE
jgi:lipopolysaccharide transport system ATP-binding protein